MKTYYCVIIIGDYSNIENILTPLISGKYNNLVLQELFISTFESNLDLMDIETQLINNQKSYIVTKMDGDNFGSIILDPKTQNHLFYDYLQKINNINNNIIKPDDLPFIDDASVDIDFTSAEEEEDFNNWIQECTNDETYGPYYDMSSGIKSRSLTSRRNTLSLDEILDKITRCGYTNLTEDEKTLLNKYSQE